MPAAEMAQAPNHDRVGSGGMRHLPFRNYVHLTQDEAYHLMRQMLSGEMDADEIADVLRFLHRKGETVAELVGFATAIREAGQPVEIDQDQRPLLDTCGTGGDAANTFNISTATAFVVAGAGQPVAKHGNRRISSKCGSADVLEALGVKVSIQPAQLAQCVEEIGIAFLYAPLLHPSIKQAQEARLLIKGQTAFNLLGPLTNPMRARVQLMGAFSIRAAEMLAQAAARLGIERAFVVHGSDGLDEITTTGPTTVFQVEDGRVQKGQWSPADFGLERASAEELKGGDPEVNAAIIRSVLAGDAGACQDIVVANAAAALLAARQSSDLKGAVDLARESIESGSALRKLEQLQQFTSIHEA